MSSRGLENRTHQSRGMDDHQSEGMEDRSVKLIRNAKRVLGFKPIDKVHVHQCMRRVQAPCPAGPVHRLRQGRVHDKFSQHMKVILELKVCYNFWW